MRTVLIAQPIAIAALSLAALSALARPFPIGR
jgi:hypothetical protein